MLVEIAGADYTTLIAHPSMQGSKATTDPLESMTFTFVDSGSTLPLTVGTPITIWDDSTPSSLIAVPTRNYLVNQLIFAATTTTPGPPWVQSGALSNLQTFQLYSDFDMAMTFNNATYSGGNNYGLISQNVGHSIFIEITPGHTYMASVTIIGSGTISNSAAFVEMQYLDGQYTPLGSLLSTTVTPTSSAQKIAIAGVAPAGTVFCQVSIGGKATVSGSNSGTITFVPTASVFTSCVCLEPVLFPGHYLADGTPISYPTPDCSTFNDDVTILPDGSTTRLRWIFNGYIKDIKVTYDGTNRLYTLDCASMGDVIDNGALINANFENTTDQTIISTLVNTYFSGMLSTGRQTLLSPPTTVQFGQNISSVAYGDCTMRDVMNSLSDSTGFIYYVDEYNFLWYNDTPFNYSTYSVNVESPDYVTAFPPQNYLVEYDGSQLENSVKVLGSQYYTVSTDTFNGDGTTKTFTLSSIPSGMNSITVGGVAQNKIGVYGIDTPGVNGVIVTYDRSSTTLHFQTAPASGTNNILATYPTYRNVAILVEDNQSIAQYKRRFFAKVTDTTIADSPTAQIRGIAEVGKYSQPLIMLTFDLNVYIPRGLAVQVSSALDGFVAQSFIVQQVNVKAEGGGIFVYSYTCGVYRPSMIDAMRNTSKALQSNTATSGSTVIQLTVESMNENLYYGDSLSGQSQASFTAKYNATNTTYGFASYN